MNWQVIGSLLRVHKSMQANLHLLYLVFLPHRLGKSLWNESRNVSSCSAEVGLSDSCITKKPGLPHINNSHENNGRTLSDK